MNVSYLGRVDTRRIPHRAQYIVRDAACVLACGQVGAEPTGDIAAIEHAMAMESMRHNVAFRRVPRPVLHLVFSWHPDDRLRVPVRQQIAVAQEGLAFLGLGGHSTILGAHANEPHPHVHTMVSLIDPNDWHLARMEQYLRMRYWVMDTNKRCRFRPPDPVPAGDRRRFDAVGKFLALLGGSPRRQSLENDLRAVDMHIVARKTGFVFRHEDGWHGKVSSLPAEWQEALYQRAQRPVSERVTRMVADRRRGSIPPMDIPIPDRRVAALKAERRAIIAETEALGQQIAAAAGTVDDTPFATEQIDF